MTQTWCKEAQDLLDKSFQYNRAQYQVSYATYAKEDFARHTLHCLHCRPIIEEAQKAGRRAHDAGKNRTPAHDPAFLSLIEGFAAGTSAPVAREWINGWDIAREYAARTEAITAKLKALKTYADLEAFLKDLNSNGELRGKRRGYGAYAFSPIVLDGYRWRHAEGEERATATTVHYLYDDCVSTGKSKVENLYRVLKVRLYNFN